MATLAKIMTIMSNLMQIAQPPAPILMVFDLAAGRVFYPPWKLVGNNGGRPKALRWGRGLEDRWLLEWDNDLRYLITVDGRDLTVGDLDAELDAELEQHRAQHGHGRA